MSSYDLIYEIIRSIPPGKVAMYGQIAFAAGKPDGTRLVTWALNALHAGSDIPWWRVINSKGTISFPMNSPDYFNQKVRLLDEGIEFNSDDTVDMDRFGWNGKN